MFDHNGIVHADKIDSYEPRIEKQYERVDQDRLRRCEAVRARLADGYWHHIRELPELRGLSYRQRDSVLDEIGAAQDGSYTCILQPEITPDYPPNEVADTTGELRRGGHRYQATGAQAAERERNVIRRGDVLALLQQGYKRTALVEQMQERWPGYRLGQFDHDKRMLRAAGIV